jgi:hypothetical protein
LKEKKFVDRRIRKDLLGLVLKGKIGLENRRKAANSMLMTFAYYSNCG